MIEIQYRADPWGSKGFMEPPFFGRPLANIT